MGRSPSTCHATGPGRFEPRLIPKHARRFAGFDDKILALYARGMPVREIQAFLAEMYGVEVSPDLISAVTDAGGGKPHRPRFSTDRMNRLAPS